MKKKGFTLIELIAVIAIMGVIITIVLPNIFNYADSLKTSSYNNLVDTIENDAKLFASRHKDEISSKIDTDTYYTLTLQQLVDDNILKVPITDPRDDSTIALTKRVYITKKNNTSFTVCYEDNDCGFTNPNAPILSLVGVNYVTLNRYSSYTDAGATATDDQEGDITNRITSTGTVNVNVPGTYTITYSVSDHAGHTSTMNRTVSVIDYVANFDYTGGYQTFTAPYTGLYKVELWGAGKVFAMAYGKFYGGGAYTSGYIMLTKDTNYYIYVGGAGNGGGLGVSANGGWNGGGLGTAVSGAWSGPPGDGATDMRLVSGAWNDVTGLRSRIMVAGGGGGNYNADHGNASNLVTSYAGGLSGGAGAVPTATGYCGSGCTAGSGGTQTTGYAFGYGQASIVNGAGNGNGAGGGGYWGGTSGNNPSYNWLAVGGGGGSSFISGYPGCNAVVSASSNAASGQSIHYSGMYFTNDIMLSGYASMPSPSGSSEFGHNGNGYAKITFVSPYNSEFSYNGNSTYQTFTAPYTGKYQVELWGAQGNDPGNGRDIGGKGAYTKGTISLTQNQVLYVYVGESRKDTAASFNGGSIGGTGSDVTNGGGVNGYGGGGATDIRITPGAWNNATSLAGRIMVAGGGGGACDYAAPSNGGAAGTLIGNSGFTNHYSSGVSNTPPTGGTQTSGGLSTVPASGGTAGSAGVFGIGGNGQASWGSGGGGGYFGGGGGGFSSYSVDSGAGGSSYISGYTGCTTYPNYVFSKTAMLSGSSVIPSPAGPNEMGHTGSGYARITYIGS